MSKLASVSRVAASMPRGLRRRATTCRARADTAGRRLPDVSGERLQARAARQVVETRVRNGVNDPSRDRRYD
jgi:hypothetical protein